MKAARPLAARGQLGERGFAVRLMELCFEDLGEGRKSRRTAGAGGIGGDQQAIAPVEPRARRELCGRDRLAAARRADQHDRTQRLVLDRGKAQSGFKRDSERDLGRRRVRGVDAVEKLVDET